jgi:hypothetical protein
MLIDIFVLYVILTAVQFAITPAVLDEAYPKQSKQLDFVTDCLERLDVVDKLDRTTLARLERVERSRDCQRITGVTFAVNEERPERRLERDINNVEDRQDELLKKIAPITYGSSLATVLIMLLYLVPSSVISGRTLGKRLMQVRVVQDDGSPLRAGNALKRYGLPVVAALLISTIGLGPIGFVIVLFVVMNWPRNPNLQGMHDRLAHTIVVDG